MGNIELYIVGRERDLGSFSVRRILPYATHRMVGPFVFFDHMGPTVFPPGEGFDVRPHPHIGLSTVTYLFEGEGRHRDSLGNDQLIVPGDINWMTAGLGIVHSERSPDEARKAGGHQHGIQCWVALPNEFEDTEPSFTHYSSDTLPSFKVEAVDVKLLVGSAFGHESPVSAHSDLFYMELKMPKGSRFIFPADGREAAAYIVAGQVQIEDQSMGPYIMAVVEQCKDLVIEATEDSHVMLIGGKPVGERVLYWNFVASSQERLNQAKRDWAGGPTAESRFKPIPGDNQEYIPLPDEPNPKGTPM